MIEAALALGILASLVLAIYATHAASKINQMRPNISRSLRCQYDDVSEARESVMHSIGYLLESFDTVEVEINIGGNGQPPFVKLTGVEKVESNEP